MQLDFNAKITEQTAREYWETNNSFKATEDKTKEKFYCLSMFPYPSGKLHMGHVRNYTIGDVISRYQRMLGKNVLQPMGWDAFGLPAENAAIKNKTAPAKWTYSNIEDMKIQLKQLGFGYDWDRELTTCSPDYYKWEQWLFTRLVDKGLAYRKTSTVNWDPVDQTVLANEQVIDGKGWRSGAVVEKRDIEQWFIKITDYAQELLDDLKKLPGWPEQVVTQQRNWIGRSEGVQMDFDIEQSGETLSIYTTRPDTLMGVTYVAVAAEHPISLNVAKDNTELAAFIEECKKGGTSEAELETMEKKGFPLGINAIHPVSGEKVPVFAANFVLMSYGTGAVMAVPAHDQRDWEFAERYNIARKQVIFSHDGSPSSIEQQAYTESGILQNSHPFDGLTSKNAFDAIAAWLEERGKGRKQINFRLRDWGVSRQRYWGCPIPVIHTEDGEISVAEEFPVTLPENVVVDGSGSPLKKMPEFYDLGNGNHRDTDTFDTFFESSWYYARYCCPDADSMLDDRARYWLPVDQYIGGIEHAILHLLYARFFNKLMRDEGMLSNDEPFTKLLTQGMVISETYYRTNADGSKDWFNPADVKCTVDDKGKISHCVLLSDGQPVEFGGIEKMSKSKNNGVDPQTLIDKYGADTVRLYTMFTAPPEQSLEWSDEGVDGAFRFVKRLWALAANNKENIVAAGEIPDNLNDSQQDTRRVIHNSLKKSLFDYDRQQFNTVVSSGMTIINALYKLKNDKIDHAILKEGLSIAIRILSPIIPHICHQLWIELNFGDNVLKSNWPQVDESAIVLDTIEIVAQVNGKIRAKLSVSADASKEAIETLALNNDNIKRFIDDKTVRKVIVVPGKLVNIVAN